MAGSFDALWNVELGAQIFVLDGLRPPIGQGIGGNCAVIAEEHAETPAEHLYREGTGKTLDTVGAFESDFKLK